MEGLPRTSAANEKPQKRVFEAAIVDVDQLAEAQARDTADARMTESKEDRSGFFLTRLAKRVWKHNLAQEYYRQKEILKARKGIKESGNLYANEGEGENPDRAAHQQAMGAIVDRFTSEYTEETLRDEERETRREMLEGPTNEKIKELIRAYAADPTMGAEAFTNQRNRIISGLDEEYAKEGAMYADNLLSIANEVRSAVTHGTKLEEFDFDVKLTLGKARESLNSETKKHTFDALVEKTQNSKIGRFLANEPAALLLGAAVYSGAKALGFSALRSNTAKLVTFGGAALAAGGIAAMKESARLERERVQHMREHAKGMQVTGEDMKRREQMEKTRYETRSAGEYISSLESSLAQLQGSEDQAAVRAATEALVDVNARIALGDRERIDLISYSSGQAVEVERTKLDLLRAQLKVALRKQEGGAAAIDLALKDGVEKKMGELAGGEEGITAKDKLFKKMKHRKVAGAALKTMAIGVGVGALVQEGMSAFDSSQTGVVEHLFGAKDTAHATGLESLRRWIVGENPRLPLGHAHEVLVGGTHVTLPENSDLVHGADGTYTLMRDGEPIAEHLKLALGADGNLTPESVTLLSEHDVHSTFSTVVSEKHVPTNESAAAFLKEHAEGTHRVHRELWYDNDTPHPFDKNELKTHWSGERGTGIDAKGNFVLSMQHMLPNGSYHDGASADAQALMKAGKLKMLFSLSTGTQHTPFEVPIDEHGNAVIAKGSALAKLMFEERHGQAVFTGRFAEIAQDMGPAKDGAETVRILSTLVGKGHDVVPGDMVIPTHTPSVTLDVPDNTIFDSPLIFPFAPRTPLERATPAVAKPKNEKEPVLEKPSSLSPVEFGYYYGGTPSKEVQAEYAKMLTPTLKENPDATLDVASESERYFDTLDDEYRAEVTHLAQQAGYMSPECKVSVGIPVAGHQEAENIERTLSTYLTQAADPKTFELVLFVNQPNVDKEGKPIASDGTLDRIHKFKEEHPELNIKVMEMVLPRENARMGYIRKLLNDATLLRSYVRGTKEDVIMVSNDADTRGIAPEYIENFTTKFEKEPNVDALMGQLDWDPEAYIRNPLVHIGTRFFQYIDTQYRKQGHGMPSSGANFAFRGSIYAAIGGYNADANLAEDVDLGRRITFARNKSTNHMPIAFAGEKVSRLYTSSRRAEKAVADGLAPAEQWEKGFSAFDDEVRKTNWAERSEAPDYDDPKVIEELTSELERILNRTVLVTNNWYGQGDAMRRTKRALTWLGLKYEFVTPSKIKITDASKLVEGLKEYKKDGMAMMARKSGQTT